MIIHNIRSELIPCCRVGQTFETKVPNRVSKGEPGQLYGHLKSIDRSNAPNIRSVDNREPTFCPRRL